MKEETRLNLFKEIDIIQSIINRMARYSFLIKGWTVTLVVVSLLLKGNNYHVVLAFIPLLIFWFLDSYFLWQERMYRKLYQWVIENRPITEEHLFYMNALRFKNEVKSKLRIMFSVTLGWFYGSITIMVIVYIIFFDLCNIRRS